MEEKNRKIGFVVSAEDDTKTAFQGIKAGAADMASSVAKSGEQAAKGVKGIGDGADEAAQKMGRAESAMALALTRATEKARIAAQAGESLSRAFEQKIEMRGLDAAKLNPLVAKLREAEDALASFKAQQAKDAGQSSFLESLRSQAQALGKTKSELLELQAAQLGVASQAAPFIAKLREAETGVGKVGVSAAQTAAAMRMVPAQFTDIVVSLQAGQAPLTVLLQQGGQLKDMFGTTGAAARGLASYVTGLVNPYTAAGAAAAVLGLAYYQGSKEADEFRKSILLTGNQAGVTVDQLNTMARAMAGVVGTQGTAAAGLAEMTRGSKVGADSLQEFSTVAIQWEKATGQAVKDTAKQFADLAKDPLQASLRLNEEMNHLTASVYNQIKALDEQGKTAEAAALAQKAYADAMSSRRAEMVQNLGYIEAGWNKVKSAAKKAWDAILDIGREGTAEQKLASVQSDLQAAERQLANAERAAFGGSRASKAEEARRRAAVEDLRAQEKSLRDGIAAGQKKAADQVASKDYVDAMEDFGRIADQFATKEVKRKQELTIAQNKYKKSVEETEKAFAKSPELMASKLADLEARYKNTLEGINKRFTEKGKSAGGISISDNQLANLEAQLAAAKQYREQLLTLGAAASDLNEGERESLKLSAQIERATNAKTKAKLAEAKAMADAWGAQVRSNDELDKSQKAHAAIIAGNYKAADSIVERAREQEAANSVYGKGRTEIERMTLATLENQMAEAQGSDRFDPKYIASLEAKIAAQKRWVAALGSADYKQFDDRLTKSLETSKEALAIQQDGLSLLGLDEVQRKRLVAQRRIELDLAKQINEIERAKFSEDPIENLIAQQDLKRKAREKAEIDTQTSLLRIQEEYVNKQVDQYDEVFRRGFADMLNNGKDGWKSFTKSLTTTFKTTVADQIYKMFLRPFVVQVVASLVGVNTKGGLGSALNSAGAGVGDLSSLGSSLLFKDFGGGLSDSVGMLGSKLFNTRLEGFGDSLIDFSGTLKQYSGVINTAGSVLSYGKALLDIGDGKYGSGIGTAVGQYFGGPIGATIGNFLGSALDKALGSRGANHSGAAASSLGIGNTAAAQRLMGDSRGDWYTDLTDRYNADLDKQLSGTVGALAGVYEKLSGYAGDAARSIELVGGFAVNGVHGDEGAVGYGQLWDRVSGQYLGGFSNRDLGTDKDKAWTSFVGQMGGLIVAELKASDIPGWMRKELEAIGDDVTVDGLEKALTAIAAADAAFKGWGDTLAGFANLSAEAQTSLLATSGTLEGLATNVNTFYSGFYTEQERMGILQRQVLEQLSGLGVTVDTSTAEAAKESFRATVEGALNAGNAELAAKLLALSGNFATAADYAGKAAEEAVQAASQALSGLMTDRRQLEAELLQAQGNATGYAAAMRAIATEGFGPAELAAYDYNQALRDQIGALDAAKTASEQAVQFAAEAAAKAEAEQQRIASERMGLETRLLGVLGDTTALRQRELDALSESNRALQEYIWSVEDAQAAYTAATTAAQSAYSGLERSVGAQKSVLQEQYNAQKAALQEQSSAAKEAWQSQVSMAQTAASEMRSIASMLGNAFESVQIDSPALSRARLESAQSLIIGARDRGDVRVAGLEDALGVASADTARMYGKWEEWAFQQGVTAAAVGDLYGEAQKQLSAQEQLIAQLQASDGVAQSISAAELAAMDAWYQQELGLLDATLKTGKDQINVLLGIDDSVLSVTDAVARLGESIAAAEAARSAADAAKMAAIFGISSSAPAAGGGGGAADSAGTGEYYRDFMGNFIELQAGQSRDFLIAVAQAGTAAVGSLDELRGKLDAAGKSDVWEQFASGLQAGSSNWGVEHATIVDSAGNLVVVGPSDKSSAAEWLEKYGLLDGSHAGGLAYVPRNGYIAELHEGEGVLNAQQNREYQRSQLYAQSQPYTPNFSAMGAGPGVVEALRAEIRALRTELQNISANTHATAGHTAATDRKLNRVVQPDSSLGVTIMNPQKTTETA